MQVFYSENFTTDSSEAYLCENAYMLSQGLYLLRLLLCVRLTMRDEGGLYGLTYFSSHPRSLMLLFSHMNRSMVLSGRKNDRFYQSR
jgi:hypothetical protein